ncbi:hypothetical protein ACI760_09050 [Capnocytophaga canimorsus]|uniref:hypothetical protein n=1 Tax=Capnocytophaga canimorsus TaxID=28188 RepID=UPI003858E155
MKKIILSLATVFAFGVVSAQDLVSSKGENYLPQEGDWSIGFNAGNALKFIGNAFNGNTDNAFADSAFGKNQTAFALPGFKNGLSFTGKVFTSDTEATRYTANVVFNYSKEKGADAKTAFGLLAGYGKEWRKGTTRLQGYYGADAFVGFGSAVKDSFSFAVGAQGFVGAEYFIFPKVAIGAQYSYPVGIEYTSPNKDSNTFTFGLGGKEGFGIASLTFNVHF